MFGRSHDPAASPAVVVAIDEESLRTAPFKGAPMLTWTGEIGRVLAATLEGGAKVAGFDIVIPTSIEQSEIPFGEGMLGEKVRGFDRDFLRALAGAAGERQGGAGRNPGRQPAGQAIARTAHRGTPAAEHPPAQRSHRQRRYRAAPAAELHRQRREGALDGGRTGLAGAGRRARIRRARQADACRLPRPRPGAEHDDAEFRGRRRRHSDLLVCRSARVRRQERQGLFSALVRRQGRHFRHRSRYRGPPA